MYKDALMKVNELINYIDEYDRRRSSNANRNPSGMEVPSLQRVNDAEAQTILNKRSSTTSAAIEKDSMENSGDEVESRHIPIGSRLPNKYISPKGVGHVVKSWMRHNELDDNSIGNDSIDIIHKFINYHLKSVNKEYIDDIMHIPLGQIFIGPRVNEQDQKCMSESLRGERRIIPYSALADLEIKDAMDNHYLPNTDFTKSKKAFRKELSEQRENYKHADKSSQSGKFLSHFRDTRPGTNIGGGCRESCIILQELLAQYFPNIYRLYTIHLEFNYGDTSEYILKNDGYKVDQFVTLVMPYESQVLGDRIEFEDLKELSKGVIVDPLSRAIYKADDPNSLRYLLESGEKNIHKDLTDFQYKRIYNKFKTHTYIAIEPSPSQYKLKLPNKK